MKRTNRTIRACSRRSTPGKRSLRRTGAALVEFAVVAPVMILFTMGMIDIGRMTMVKQMLVNASREGARQATLMDASNASVTQLIVQQLKSSGIDATVQTVPASITSAAPGATISVTVSAKADQVSWTKASMFMAGKTLTASTSMRRESL